LSNVLYVGKVAYQGETYDGEHEAIVEQAVWEQVNARLAKEWNHGRVRSSPKAGHMATGARSRLVASERAPRLPRITRLLALALRFEELIGSGAVQNYAALAHVAHLSRSRVTQMTSLLNLAPDIQEEILFLNRDEAEHFRISEPSLRKMTATLLWNQQREQWKALRRPARNSTEVN